MTFSLCSHLIIDIDFTVTSMKEMIPPKYIFLPEERVCDVANFCRSDGFSQYEKNRK